METRTVSCFTSRSCRVTNSSDIFNPRIYCTTACWSGRNASSLDAAMSSLKQFHKNDMISQWHVRSGLTLSVSVRSLQQNDEAFDIISVKVKRKHSGFAESIKSIFLSSFAYLLAQSCV